MLGESPLWDAAEGLRWLDITGRRLCTVGLRGDTWSVKLSRRVTAIEPGPCDAVFAVTTRGFGWLLYAAEVPAKGSLAPRFAGAAP
jgi:sugar lactone lactonase YvrE